MDESHVRRCPSTDRTCEKVNACRENNGDCHLHFIPCLASVYRYHSTYHFISHDIKSFLPQKSRINSCSILN